MLSLALLLSAVGLSAQTLIKANFHKGDTTVYQTVTKGEMALPMGGGNKQFTSTADTRFVVLDANPQGYKIEVTTIKQNVEGDDEVASQMGNQLDGYIVNVPVVYQTDVNGKIQKIVNYQDVVAKASKQAISNIDSIYKANPEIANAIPKEKMIMGVSELFDEKNVISAVEQQSVFGMYGKTLKAGDTENMTLAQGIKAITTYDVTPVLSTIAVVGKSKANMTEQDVKQMIIENMKKMGLGEEATSQIENNWGQMKAMGMTNIDFSSTTTYHFLKSGWANDTASESKTKIMGMNLNVNSNTKILSRNWK